jgi:hypothetical protein
MKVVRRSSIHRHTVMTVAVICTISSTWWPSIDASAQEAVHPVAIMATSADSTLWSLQRPESTTAPYLTISMTNNGNTIPDSFFRVGAELSNLSAADTMPLGDPAVPAERSERLHSAPLVLLSSAERGAEVPGPMREELIPASPPNQSSHNRYSLLHDGLTNGRFLYENQVNCIPPKSSLADHESFMSKFGQAPGAVVELKTGGLDLPVLLSSAKVWQ